ncbi:unnamed protein product, partial [Adineta steineri]
LSDSHSYGSLQQLPTINSSLYNGRNTDFISSKNNSPQSYSTSMQSDLHSNTFWRKTLRENCNYLSDGLTRIFQKLKTTKSHEKAYEVMRSLRKCITNAIVRFR